jgi:hypothetical protein
MMPSFSALWVHVQPCHVTILINLHRVVGPASVILAVSLEIEFGVENMHRRISIRSIKNDEKPLTASHVNSQSSDDYVESARVDEDNLGSLRLSTNESIPYGVDPVESNQVRKRRNGWCFDG